MADNFSEHVISVVLTHQATMQFREITAYDFPELGHVYVEELTAPTTALAFHQTMGIRSFSDEGRSLEINLKTFRRILTIQLGEPGKANILHAIRLLEQRTDVYSAEPDTYIEYDAVPFIPNDPRFHEQWALQSIGVHHAWRLANGAGVTVGVIDSGIQANHEDLITKVDRSLSMGTYYRSRIWPFPEQIISIDPFVDERRNDAGHIVGHGTQVAGVIGASVGNNIGIAGVGRHASIASLRVAMRGNPRRTAAVRAIIHATSRGIPILNYSAGGDNRYSDIETAIRDFPGLFVATAGNNAQNNRRFPGALNLPNVIGVGALDSNGQRSIWRNSAGVYAGSSGFGTNIEIFAPGSNILTTSPTGYVSVNGTSVAAPHVAGVAALMLSLIPNLTGPQLRVLLMDTADTITITDPHGNPMQVRSLNAENAVRHVMGLPLAIRTAEQLQRNLTRIPSARYELMNNIDLAGREWQPIPNFTGTLDGNGHTINNMRITNMHVTGETNIGLFGVNRGTIRGIYVANAYIGMGRVPHVLNVGIIAGQNFGTLSAAHASGTVRINSPHSRVGGIAGWNHGLIQYSWLHNNSRMYGEWYLGGTVGVNDVTGTVRALSVHRATLNHTLSYMRRPAGGIVALNRGRLDDLTILYLTLQNAGVTPGMDGVSPPMGMIVGESASGSISRLSVNPAANLVPGQLSSAQRVYFGTQSSPNVLRWGGRIIGTTVHP